MSEYNSFGTDFDQLFEARSTSKRPDVGYKLNGTDISSVYEKLSKSQRIPEMRYESGGSDLSLFFKGNALQYSVTAKLSSVRSTSWSSQIQHEFTVSFPGAQARTDFFYYGGRIRLSANLVGFPATAKNTSWANLLTNMGLVEFAEVETYRNGSTAVSSVGNSNLTSTYQTASLFAGAGAYSNNYCQVSVKQNSATVISVLFTFLDGFGTVDESVSGTLTSSISERRHPIAFTPTFTNTILLTAGS